MRSGKISIRRLLGIAVTALIILCVIAATAAAGEARTVSDGYLAGAEGSDSTSVHILVIVPLMLALLAEVTVVLILVLKNFLPSGSSKTEQQPYPGDAAQDFAYGYPDTLFAGNEGYVLLRKNSHEIIPINKAQFYLGKEKARVDYCITDNSYVSRRHARISVYDGKCFLCDLGSTNCTYVNGIRISPDREIALLPGDRIGLSDEEFVFIDKPAIAS